MADSDDRKKNTGDAGTQSGNGGSDEFSIEVEEVTASDDSEEKSGPAPEKSQPLRYEDEISRPSIMVADDHKTEELSGELKEDPIVMSFVKVVGNRRSARSGHEPPMPPSIKPDTKPPPPPPPKGGDEPPTPPAAIMDNAPPSPLQQPPAVITDAPPAASPAAPPPAMVKAPPPPVTEEAPSQEPAWDLTAAVEDERPSTPETPADDRQSEQAPAIKANSVPTPPPPPQSFSKPPPAPLKLADTKPPPPALTEEVRQSYSIITGGSRPPPPPAIKPDTKPPPPPPPAVAVKAQMPPAPSEDNDQQVAPPAPVQIPDTKPPPELTADFTPTPPPPSPVDTAETAEEEEKEEQEDEGRKERISEIEEIQEVEEIDETPAEAEDEKQTAAPEEAEKAEEVREEAEEVAEEVEEVEAVEAVETLEAEEEAIIEEIDIIPPSVSKPPPPPPTHRPSKEPPPPPNGAEPMRPPPPPDAVKGLSMKSIEGHLPSIIAIPEDEVPRDEDQREAAAEKGVSAPDAAPLLAPIPKTKKKWFEEIFDENYMRVLPELTELQRRREINFVEKNLAMKPGSMILDLCCGTGLHCIGLAKKDYQMVGLDLSVAMLAIASEEAQDSDCKINFIQKDMRELDFKDVFDAIYCVGSSFGYFDDEENEKVVQGVHRALKPGGMFLLEVDNRDYVARQQPGLLWFEGEDVVCMEETSFNFITSRLRAKRSLLFENGTKKTHLYSIRLYSLHELGRILHNAGFRVDSVGGHRAAPRAFCGEDSVKIIIVAQKRFGNDKK